MTNEQMALRKLIADHGSQRAAAKHLGISEVYFSDLKRGKRAMSAKILGKLGYRRAVVAK